MQVFRALTMQLGSRPSSVSEADALGKGMPVVEKNTRSILSFTHVLRFGISDVAEMLDREVGAMIDSSGPLEKKLFSWNLLKYHGVKIHLKLTII